MPQSAEQKMRSVSVEGSDAPFEVPESWDDFQTASYLKAYREKYPDRFAKTPPVAPKQPAEGVKQAPPLELKGPSAIGPRKPGFLERTTGMFQDILPERSPRTVHDPKYGQQQLITPEGGFTPLEQYSHPVRTAVDEFVGGLSSPGNLALIVASQGLGAWVKGAKSVARYLPRAMSSVFGAQMLRQAWKQSPEFRAAAKRGDANEAKRLLTHVILDAGLGAAGMMDAIYGGGKGKGKETTAPKEDVGVPKRPESVETATAEQKQEEAPQKREGVANEVVAKSEEIPSPDVRGKESVSRGTPKEVIENAGLVDKGELFKDSGIFQVEDPAHPGKTMAVKAKDFTTPEALRERMAAKLKEFGVAHATAEPVISDWSEGVKPTVKKGDIWTEDPSTPRIIFAAERAIKERGLPADQVGKIRKLAMEKVGTGPRFGERYAKLLQEAIRTHDAHGKSEVPERAAEPEVPAVAESASRQPGAPMPTVQQQRPAIDRTLRESITGGWNQIANMLSPASRGPHAKASALSLREAAAKIAADDEKADHALKEYRAHFDRLLRNNPTAGLDWIDQYETGAAGQMGQKDRLLADKWKDLQTRTWREVQRREGMQRFIDNYFPHLFKDPAQAAQVFSRRPLEGPRSWRFKREFPTLKDALSFARSQGITLEPMYENPVDYMTAKLHEMNKYVHLHDFVEEMKAVNVLRFSPDIKPPIGMAKIEDPVGTVWGSSTEKITLREAYDKVLFEQLNQFARSLGIDHIRKVKLRGGAGVWGYTIKGMDKVWTKHAGPEEVLTHELGHQLHFRYPELDELIKDPNTKEELRTLADMRYEGTPPTDVSEYYKRYTRKGPEKIANLIHAYVHMRERGRKIAPNTFARMDQIIEGHPELAPLRDIHPGVALGSNEVTENLYVGRRIFGYYYAPEGAARVINNYLKPGLAGKPLFELARRPANLLNQIQLGTVSGFHFVFTGMDTTVGMWSLGLQRIGRGDISGGLGAMVRGNILTAPIETYLRGSKVLKEFYGKPQGQFYADTVNRLIEAGGRVKMESFYHNSSVESFMRAWRRGEKGKAAADAIPAAVEALASPIMKHWVPRMKLGTFSLLAEEELARLGPNANLWEHRGALARAWDSTDNRLGQLVYDNLFWNRTLKDIGLISVRSLGWNLGTFREIGGGYIDAAKFAATRGKSGVTPRLAYTLALPAVIALHGAMLQYALTGKGPDELLDYFYPKSGRTNPDGSPERIVMPSYMKDEISYGSGFRLGVDRGLRQVGTTLGHKANPELSMLKEMLWNRDFYGTKIRNEDDPIVKQAEDMMKYVGTQFEPFWIRNLEQRKQAEGEITPRNFIESMFGIMPAPRTITRSTAEALAADYLSEHMPAGARTPEKAKQAHVRGELMRQFRTNDEKRWTNLSKAMKDGQISQADRRDIFRSMRMTPLQQMSERLGLEQILNVYDHADEKEKEQLKRILHGKMHLLRGIPGEKQDQVRSRLNKIFGKLETPREEDDEGVPEREPVSL